MDITDSSIIGISFCRAGRWMWRSFRESGPAIVGQSRIRLRRFTRVAYLLFRCQLRDSRDGVAAKERGLPCNARLAEPFDVRHSAIEGLNELAQRGHDDVFVHAGGPFTDHDAHGECSEILLAIGCELPAARPVVELRAAPARRGIVFSARHAVRCLCVDARTVRRILASDMCVVASLRVGFDLSRTP
jgi:hypothetical protein